ncbi:MAG: four-helix bundle copper-binding protein [Planctomycetia bacterium]|nr:four-helix bundle copper-binding protein [Planctomycetia bacterium]
MSCRHLISLTAALVLLLPLAAQEQREQNAAPKNPGDRPQAQDQRHMHLDRTAKLLNECMLHCQICAAHCGKLVEEGKKEHFQSMKLCAECAEVCALTGKLAICRSAVLGHQAEACAKICERCAEQCEKSGGDEAMKACAKFCRDCAKACRELSANELKNQAEQERR